MIGVTALVGLVCLVVGIWLLVNQSPDDLPVQLAVGPVSGIVAGILFLGFAMFEFLRRLRHGPQEPGRRARS